MLSYTQVKNQFDAYFDNHLEFPNNPIGLYEPCRYILKDSGKRIRPALAILSAQLFNDDIPEDAFKIALALELFHNFTLIHDDIMDNAPLRRGNPTIHEKYNVSTGILSGDVMNIFSYKILASIDSGHLKSILDLFNTTAVEVCEGQQLDMDFEKQNDVSVADYLNMIRLKTSVLLACSMKSGAVLMDATQNDACKLYDVGLNLGLAFQLQDDYLDTFGEELNTGKSVGGDILANKKTYLYISALSKANEQQKATFLKNHFTSNQEKVAKTIQIFKDLDIHTKTQKLIKDYYQKAYQSLAEVDILSARKQAIFDLIQSLEERKK